MPRRNKGYFTGNNDPCSSRTTTRSMLSKRHSRNSAITEQLQVMEKARNQTNYENGVVFHCAKCNLVLGDSLAVCGEVDDLNAIISSKVTEMVKVGKKFEVCKEGFLANCIYKVLECYGCQHSLGGVLYSTPEHRSSLRNLFLLKKESFNCYMLKSCAFIKSTNVSFKNRPLKPDLDKLQNSLEVQIKQFELLNGNWEESTISKSFSKTFTRTTFSDCY